MAQIDPSTQIRADGLRYTTGTGPDTPPTPADGDVLEYDATAGGYVFAPNTGGGSSDHGTLTGLADDDHSQYHNDTRGDARYYTQSAADAAFEAAGAVATHEADTTSVHGITDTSALIIEGIGNPGTLSIGSTEPGSPVNGDIWLDTTGA